MRAFVDICSYTTWNSSAGNESIQLCKLQDKWFWREHRCWCEDEEVFRETSIEEIENTIFYYGNSAHDEINEFRLVYNDALGIFTYESGKLPESSWRNLEVNILPNNPVWELF